MLAIGLLACSAARAQAQKEPCATVGNNNDFLGIQTIRLWPGDAPQAKGKACEDIPTLTIFEPQSGMGNGSAVVIFPGGAYIHLAANLEALTLATTPPASARPEACRRPRDDGRPSLARRSIQGRSEEHTSELQSLRHLVCRLLL